MTKQSEPSHTHSGVTRRRFMATGLTAFSTTAAGTAVLDQLAFVNQASAAEPSIDPGFVAPHYYGPEEEKALLDVLESGSPFRYYGPGKPHHVKDFELRFAEYMQSPYGLAVTSGTAALDCAITGLEIGPGDEVIVPAYTWWSDYTCVVNAGALPVFADIDRTLNLDPKDFARRITPRTKAVIPVHLLGGPCDMEPILETAKKHGIKILEDCAQCVGGSYRGKKLGSIGDVGIYSFQLHKMISSGEGGAVVSADPLVFERAARFHDMGTSQRCFITKTGSSLIGSFSGENFRMSEFTGSVLGAQLPKLNTMIHDMRRNADAVREGIKDLPNIRMRKRPDPKGDNGYAVYFELENKTAQQRCIELLRKQGIPASTLTGSILLPIAESVIKKRTRHPNWPSFNSPEGKAIEYGPDSCRQTLGIYDRFVQIRIGPKYTDRINNRIVAAIRKVYPQVT